MAILQKLKSLLGFNDSKSERGGTREVGVTVEREGTADDGTAVDADRDEPTDDASVEPPQSAATGSSAGRSSESTTLPEESDEPSATGDTETADTSSTAESTDAADESPVQEAEPDVETEPEPDVETEPDTEDTASETADDTDSAPKTETEPEPESEAESEPETDAQPEETNQEPVVEIKGIGPAYADRLAGAGVDTIGELAAADAAELAEQTDISETRIQGWIDRAEVR